MTKGQRREMSPVNENEDGLLSSGDGVATEGEEEEEEIPVRSSIMKDQEEHQNSQSISEEGEQLTPYVAKCYGHLETLRKRKREQEEQVETLVEETFGQIEAIMQEMMRGLQERHAASHAQFEATGDKLMRSLRAHNRVRTDSVAVVSALTDVIVQMEKKLKMIAAILLREDDGKQEVE
ncbi:hypothetical protein F441_04647 [Phytophthora nicotianae CJ01A1]|uniref:Uncharacterized protein n=5 Tax=Phytophthora nicotianae TaxID=4792 RepID=W2QIF8_PHYN3|nr:hypothetical protein PPTG_08959 [Phytophthora nicotianae INRA-310]ETK92026.1 hypothetical protein L915_04545 [Phytophthora nicotianae]ETO80912.1 hypothetical protein F444_04691 [Phytophthora nicotianae P1976]ETP21940.1 hypothetical protein F441_04647 [Phytophthora nicotianae CJ01A1]ETP49845.1 hypothetical protein F442_04708 [Phytophthora nicotianae P10297]ETL45408.1 hypothetical protein L916_04499 [Phytophthora nicotianae]